MRGSPRILVSAAAQGPAGPPGQQGPAGFSTGFGQVRYAEAAGSAPVALAAFARTELTFVIDPSQTQNSLNPPFTGALAFDGATITPRALNDALFVLTNLLVTAAVAGGAIKFDIDVGSPAGPTGSATESLLNPAGQAERVTGILYVQTLANFMANGARLFLTSSVPISIVNAAVILIPQSIHPAS